jgi:hypothetical protein
MKPSFLYHLETIISRKAALAKKTSAMHSPAKSNRDYQIIFIRKSF